MAYTAHDITSFMEKSFPSQDKNIMKNHSDVSLESGKTFFPQFIIGVTPQDPGVPAFEHYKLRMNERLKGINTEPHFVGWPFKWNELDDLKTVLGQLTAYFDVKLDVDKMTRSLEVTKNNSEWFYIVITVILYPVVTTIQ